VRRYFWYGITLIAWIAAIVIFAGAYAHHQLLQLAPIFAYNCPQGVFGWTLAIAVVFTFVSIGPTIGGFINGVIDNISRNKKTFVRVRQIGWSLTNAFYLRISLMGSEPWLIGKSAALSLGADWKRKRSPGIFTPDSFRLVIC